MSNILNKKPNFIDATLSSYQYNDFQLMADNDIHIINTGVTVNNLVADLNFTSIGVCSDVQWSGAISKAGNLCNIGLTGIDNKYINSLTGTTLNLDDNLNFCVYSVSGDNYDYSLEFNDENYVTLNGGFYQGFYRLADYKYNVLPTHYQYGWTFETWIRQKELVNNNDILNDINSNNKNFIWYWGTRAENKFGDFFQGEAGLDTCDSKISLSPEFTFKDTTFDDINPFLFYTRTRVCTGVQYTEVINYTDYCDDLIDNVLGLRVTDEGALNLRIITCTGYCVDTEYNEDIIIKDFNSISNLIALNTWHHISIIYEPYNYIDECRSNETLGDLKFFVDGYLKMKIENFKQYKPYKLSTHKDKQLAVPYNMSFGGGSQGLLESITFNGPDTGNTFTKTVKDLEFTFTECDVFKSVYINGTQFKPTELLGFNKYNDFCDFLAKNITNRYGSIEFKLKDTINPQKIVVTIKAVEDTINFLEFIGKFITPEVKREYTINNLSSCSLIEEYFSGSFIGDLGRTRFYNTRLSIQELRENIQTEKTIYN